MAYEASPNRRCRSRPTGQLVNTPNERDAHWIRVPFHVSSPHRHRFGSEEWLFGWGRGSVKSEGRGTQMGVVVFFAPGYPPFGVVLNWGHDFDCFWELSKSGNGLVSLHPPLSG